MSAPSTTAVEPHPSSFTTLWTAEQVRKIRRAGLMGQPVSTTIGGPHTTAPRFSRAGVRPGDDVFPINIRDGRLMLLARIRVGEILPVDAFVARHPDWFDPILRHPEFRRLELPSTVRPPGRSGSFGCGSRTTLSWTRSARARRTRWS